MMVPRLLFSCRYLPGLLLLGAGCSSPDKPAAPPPAAPPAPARPAPVARPAADTATGQFSWENEVCHNTGYFPKGRYTPAQLRDSYALVNRSGVLFLRQDVRLPEELRADTLAIRLRRLEAEYRRQRAELGALRVVPVPYWQRLQRLRLLELDEDYRLQHLMLRAYLAPELLLADTAPACRPYAEALASADTTVLLGAWRQLVDQQKRLNGYPDDVEARYQEQRHSAGAAGYARVNLMGYGWWNCVNGAKKYGDVYNRLLPENAFERLFTRIVADDCADVD